MESLAGFLAFFLTLVGVAGGALLLVFGLWFTRKHLTVRVIDARGEPVAGARVVGHHTWGSHRQVGPTGEVVEHEPWFYSWTLGRTGADGRWSGTLFLRNPWGLTATAEGHAESELRVLRDGRAPREHTLQLGKPRREGGPTPPR